MNEIAAGGGAFPALIVTLIKVAVGGAVGWWLRKMIAPQGRPDTPQELGRAWAGWVIFVSCATQLSAFIGKLDAASFFYWLIGGGAMTAVAYAAGLGYGKWFKFSSPPISSRHDLPRAPSVGIPDPSVAEEDAYARAADELETNQIDKATWARAFAESDGDADKTKARYIAFRVKKLIGQAPLQASITRDSLQSRVAEQSAAIDTGNSPRTQDEKDRLWKLAQEQALGHGAGVLATHAIKPLVAQQPVTASDAPCTDNPHRSNASDIQAVYRAVIIELRNVTLLMLVGMVGTATFMTALVPQYHSYASNLGYWAGVAVGNSDSNVVGGPTLIISALLPTIIYLIRKIYNRNR